MNNEESRATKGNPTEDEPNEMETRLAELERAGLEKDRRIEVLTGKNTALEAAIVERDSEISALKQSAVSFEETQRQTQERLSQAVLGYQSLIVQSNPEVPAELITGDSVEAVNGSLARARELVSRVKQGLEAENLKIRIPAGAPVRTPPDAGALSAREKIHYAIGGNR